MKAKYILNIIPLLFLVFIYGCDVSNDIPVFNENKDNAVMMVNVIDSQTTTDDPINLQITEMKALIVNVDWVYTDGTYGRLENDPFVFRLDKTNGLKEFSAGKILNKTIKSVKFLFCVRTGTESVTDPEFIQNQSSFIAKYTINGQPGTFYIKNEIQFECQLPAQYVMNDTKNYLTLRINTNSIFKYAGTNYVDPGNPQNLELIINNLKNNIGVCVDNNLDGVPD